MFSPSQFDAGIKCIACRRQRALDPDFDIGAAVIGKACRKYRTAKSRVFVSRNPSS